MNTSSTGVPGLIWKYKLWEFAGIGWGKDLGWWLVKRMLMFFCFFYRNHCISFLFILPFFMSIASCDILNMEPSAPPIPMPSRRGTLGLLLICLPMVDQLSFSLTVFSLSLGQTLRDGVGAFGREVGGFFGLTDESQVGMYGWNEITQMRAEVSWQTK